MLVKGEVKNWTNAVGHEACEYLLQQYIQHWDQLRPLLKWDLFYLGVGILDREISHTVQLQGFL